MEKFFLIVYLLLTFFPSAIDINILLAILYSFTSQHWTVQTNVLTQQLNAFPLKKDLDQICRWFILLLNFTKYQNNVNFQKFGSWSDFFPLLGSRQSWSCKLKWWLKLWTLSSKFLSGSKSMSRLQNIGWSLRGSYLDRFHSSKQSGSCRRWVQ